LKNQKVDNEEATKTRSKVEKDRQELLAQIAALEKELELNPLLEKKKAGCFD
jgi:hypothetical protein